jgi:hypothetical protein
MATVSFAQQIAELIHAEAQSGSAFWDELNGPSAVLAQEGDKHTVTIPLGYDDQDNPTTRVCVITVEEVQP